MFRVHHLVLRPFVMPLFTQVRGRSRRGASPQRSPGSQEPLGSCKDLSPPSHERTIDSQQYDSSNDPRYDGPYPRSSGSAPTEANKTQEPASEDRSHDAYDDRDYYPARIIPRHDRFCQCASDKPDYDPENEGIKHK